MKTSIRQLLAWVLLALIFVGISSAAAKLVSTSTVVAMDPLDPLKMFVFWGDNPIGAIDAYNHSYPNVGFKAVDAKTNAAFLQKYGSRLVGEMDKFPGSSNMTVKPTPTLVSFDNTEIKVLVLTWEEGDQTSQRFQAVKDWSELNHRSLGSVQLDVGMNFIKNRGNEIALAVNRLSYRFGPRMQTLLVKIAP